MTKATRRFGETGCGANAAPRSFVPYFPVDAAVAGDGGSCAAAATVRNLNVPTACMYSISVWARFSVHHVVHKHFVRGVYHGAGAWGHTSIEPPYVVYIMQV